MKIEIVKNGLVLCFVVDYEAMLMKNKQLEEQIKAREEAEDEELVRFVQSEYLQNILQI